MPERVGPVRCRRAFRAFAAQEQQRLVAGVCQGVDRFGEHGRRGQKRRDELGHRDARVAVDMARPVDQTFAQGSGWGGVQVTDDKALIALISAWRPPTASEVDIPAYWPVGPTRSNSSANSAKEPKLGQGVYERCV